MQGCKGGRCDFDEPLAGIVGKSFEKATNNANNSSAIPLSQTDKTEARKCRKMNRDTGAALNSMTDQINKKTTVEEISADDVGDNCGAEPSDIETTTRDVVPRTIWKTGA